MCWSNRAHDVLAEIPNGAPGLLTSIGGALVILPKAALRDSRS
jgi:hypothetical protein